MKDMKTNSSGVLVKLWSDLPHHLAVLYGFIGQPSAGMDLLHVDHACLHIKIFR